MFSATASARSRPLSLHSSRRATRFVPSKHAIFARYFRALYCRYRHNISPGTDSSEGFPRANSREWLERLRWLESRDHVVWNGGPPKLFRVILTTGRPYSGFVALHRQFAIDRQAVFDVETGTPELADS